jgi:hypothetical protein
MRQLECVSEIPPQPTNERVRMKQSGSSTKRAELKARIAMTVMTNHRAITSDHGAIKSKGAARMRAPSP